MQQNNYKKCHNNFPDIPVRCN